MIVSDTAIKKRIAVVVMAIIILGVGIWSYFDLPREKDPDVTIPHVFVSTTYKGVSSVDIEKSITIKIENKLKGLDQVKKIESTSREGSSLINIEFLAETDIDEVLQKVKDKVDEAKGDLPNDLEDDPSVFEVNISEMPIVNYSLYGTCGPACLKEIAEDLEGDIEAIPGVLEVDVIGGLDREIKIEVDPDKLAYYRIPITTFQGVVSSENKNTSGGSITLGDGKYQLRVPGEFETPNEIFNLVISSHEGKPIYLKDVAKVVDGFKDETSRARLDGRDAVSIQVKKRIGENIIDIIDKTDAIIEKQKATWPKGTRITKLMDGSKDIRVMIADLENNIITGLILVVVVLFFALGIRNAILVSLAIPFSMFLSFTILQVIGITLNMVVLFSLTLALGMLVDNAIVIVENVYRYMEQGVPRIQAAMKATSEVAYPVIGSTITTLAAFFPLIFWPGIMGEFMKYLPITLIVTLSSSLFVAMVINPALTAIFMKVKGQNQTSNKNLSADEIAKGGEKPVEIKGLILVFYEKILRKALKHRFAVLCASFAILVILIEIYFLLTGIEKGTELFPEIDPAQAYVNIDPPQGADLEYLDRIAKKVELIINGTVSENGTIPVDLYPDSYKFRKYTTRSGEEFYGPSEFENIEHIFTGTEENARASKWTPILPNHIGLQFLDYEERKHPTADDLEKIRDLTKNIPGARITIAKGQEGPPTGPPINLEISGDDFKTLGMISKKIQEEFGKVAAIEDLQDDYVEGLPSVRIRIDRQKAALFNLSTSSIGFALKTAYNGLNISTYREEDDDYDITVTLAEKDRQVTDVLRKLMIPTPSGQLVPLTTIASIDYTGGIGDIVRINHNRTVTIKANVDPAKATGIVARQQAEKMFEQFPMPAGYTATFTGENEFEQESKEFLLKAFLIAICLIFLILVVLFNSVIQPLIILTSVVLSLGGVFLGLTVGNFPFGIIMTGVGVISLAGVVVNNAIVLIDYTNKLRERGYSISDAVVYAGATRLRPVMLTAITTVLGLLPMVTGVSFDFHNWSISWVSESTAWWETMAIVVIFGLAIATFLTLVVVPTLYSFLDSLKMWASAFFKWVAKIYWKPVEKYI